MNPLSRVSFLTLIVAVALGTVCHAQPRGGRLNWRNALNQPADWYDSDEAVRIAENVLLHQHDNGGWGKNIDMARVLSDDEKADLRAHHNDFETLIDNGATYTQIHFLALVHQATGQAQFAEAARRGLEYLLSAQYDNGGWPMCYPLQQGYYSHITFNDGSMIGVMRVLRDVANGRSPYEFVDAKTRRRARRAIDKGLDVILKCQIVVDGKPTAWCAQHDEVDFSPQPARTYELVSLSGMESVGIVEYLMEIDDPSPEVKRAIDGAVAWLRSVKIEGIAVKWQRDSSEEGFDRIVVADPSAPPVWARFYEVGTNRPMFVGRDGIIHEHLADIEWERRTNYAWLGDFASDMLAKKYPAWQKKWGDAPADSK
jgi:PelA/Pel-15E family pectate lyase